MSMPPRVRRNVSPKQGPMRATVPVALMRQGVMMSPATTWPRDGGGSRGSQTTTTTITTTNTSSNNGHSSSSSSSSSNYSASKSPDTRSPGASPGVKGDKSKQVSSKSSSSVIRRTASLDAIYLKGQWPKDTFRTYCGTLLVDKSTQTPDEWNETLDRKKMLPINQTRSSSVGNGDQINFIRRSLQRNKEGSRPGSSNGQRHSPIHGDHHAIPFLAPGQQMHIISRPVPIHNIPKPLMPRMRNSVEGLNQEIERFLVQKGISGSSDERNREPTPDGHRAPIADLFCKSTRTVNTQTPSNSGSHGGDESSQSSGQTSRCHSISPQIIIGPMYQSFSSQNDNDNQVYEQLKTIKDLNKSPSPEPEQKYCSSPHNKFLAREPPDGCERVKILEEPRSFSTLPDPIKPRDSFILQPSQGSAFCPLQQRSCLEATEFALKPVTQATHAATIEGQ